MSGWLRAVLASGLVLAVIGVTSAQDTVIFKNRTTKKEDRYVGTIEDESPSGIKIKVKEGKETPTKVVPTSDILVVQYDAPGVSASEFRSLYFAKEDRARTDTSAERRKRL